MPRTINNTKTSTVGESKKANVKTSGEGSKSSANKKQEAVNVKVPTARERAKSADEGRRSDANSNEL